MNLKKNDSVIVRCVLLPEHRRFSKADVEFNKAIVIDAESERN